MPAHQRQIAVETKARVARATLGDIGLAAVGRRGGCSTGCSRRRMVLVLVLRHAAKGGTGERDRADTHPQLARQLCHYSSGMCPEPYYRWSDLSCLPTVYRLRKKRLMQV